MSETVSFASRFKLPPRRRKTPSILQIEAVECGAASLAMVLAHHGRWVSLEDLRLAAGVSRDGTKASNLLKAARSFGLVAKGFRKEASQLHEVRWPAILHWNFNHFVVLEGIVGKSAFINDPASGRRTVSLSELSDAFTGVVLAFEPGEGFVKEGAKPLALPLLLDRLRHSKLGLLFVLVASLALVLPGIALPIFSRVFIDDILVGRQEDWFVPFILALGIVIALRGVMTLIQQWGLVRLEAKIAVVPATQLLWRMLQLPMAFFMQRHPGELASRLGANDRIAQLLSGQLATNAFNLVSVLAYGAIMVFFSPMLALAVFAVQLVYAFVITWGGKRQLAGAIKQSTEVGRLVAATLGPIRAIETVKSSNLETQFFHRWAGHQARLLNIRAELGVTEVIINAVPVLLQALTVVLVLGLGSLQVMNGQMSLGTLVAFQGLAASFGAPVLGLVSLAGQMQMIRADLLRVADVLRAKPDSEAGQDGVPLSAEIEVQSISFGYSPLDPPLIEDFSLVLKPGARVALVGGSGSGKSTVGRLLAGLAKPWEGDIVVGGVPSDRLSHARRSELLGYVDQEIFLFEGTVRENLTLWNANVDDERIVGALADAAVLDDIVARQDQIDCQVDEGGTNFSGGQRQRLEIARALVGNPSLLILDEATAALDPVTEKLIDDNLRRRGCGCLIIAHRLSTIRDADEIIVMKAGRVVERGDHETLMALNGEYVALVGSY
ncbi:NHLP family bacteriocin export ABC transporter peptidase/permease/ATPase subunit [Devosia sp. BK]|uniref:NHLP family bacteriocin export ABC transporter peptidase/permease/ATPase subunit n=1 Tax=Devosia sp. BK TaxID=2871706 RepID=UPI00293ADDC3|nr:NHLP family bacteriocin export ABC transporter peptidase/permease/ATPase subunit [Devosia sp. BK]MDV3252678.1 NHLP family bacteriocin export ABC transporter peptidase/permease/ATPase subunit [Devosia sp. BK]